VVLNEREMKLFSITLRRKNVAKDDAKIKSISDLRDHALMTIERLSTGEIDTSQLLHCKLCDSVIHTIKTQLEYSRMTGENPEIPFMLTQVKVIY